MNLRSIVCVIQKENITVKSASMSVMQSNSFILVHNSQLVFKKGWGLIDGMESGA